MMVYEVCEIDQDDYSGGNMSLAICASLEVAKRWVEKQEQEQADSRSAMGLSEIVDNKVVTTPHTFPSHIVWEDDECGGATTTKESTYAWDCDESHGGPYLGYYTITAVCVLDDSDI